MCVCVCVYKHLYIFNFIFNTVHIVDRNAYPCRPLIRIERVSYGESWLGHMFQSFYLFIYFCVNKEGRRRAPLLPVKLYERS